MDPERARQLLSSQRKQIKAELAGLHASAETERSEPDPYGGDDAAELYEQEFDQGRSEQLQDQLAAIERAERRLEQGTYGVSIESGQPIQDARLEAIPWAERTADEQERLDRG